MIAWILGATATLALAGVAFVVYEIMTTGPLGRPTRWSWWALVCLTLAWLLLGVGFTLVD